MCSAAGGGERPRWGSKGRDHRRRGQAGRRRRGGRDRGGRWQGRCELRLGPQYFSDRCPLLLCCSGLRSSALTTDRLGIPDHPLRFNSRLGFAPLSAAALIRSAPAASKLRANRSRTAPRSSRRRSRPSAGSTWLSTTPVRPAQLHSSTSLMLSLRTVVLVVRQLPLTDAAASTAAAAHPAARPATRAEQQAPHSLLRGPLSHARCKLLPGVRRRQGSCGTLRSFG